jgi:hypothetical protein
MNSAVYVSGVIWTEMFLHGLLKFNVFHSRIGWWIFALQCSPKADKCYSAEGKTDPYMISGAIYIDSLQQFFCNLCVAKF